MVGRKEELKEYKKEEKEWNDKLKKNEEHLKKLESEKKREQHEGELGVVLWAGVNTIQAELDRDTRPGQYLSPYCVQCVDSVLSIVACSVWTVSGRV